jgi:hypothetical protein
MDSMMSTLMNSLSGDNLSTIGKLVGTDSDGTRSILGTVVPLLTGAMAKTAAQPGGANALVKMLGGRQVEGVADDVGGYLRNPDVSGGASILNTLLGSQQGAIADMIARKTGFSTEMIGRALTLIAPVVLGFVAKRVRQQNMDASALTAFLGEQSKTALAGAPDAMDVISSLMGKATVGGGFLDRLKRLFGG